MQELHDTLGANVKMRQSEDFKRGVESFLKK